MENLKEKKVAFFMNHFSSLKMWDENGTLSKETKVYNKLAEVFKKIYIFSYGDKSDLQYKGFLSKNLVIICKPNWIPTATYEIILPFLHWKTIKECDIFKTNQNSGALAPSIAKLFFRKKNFIVRSGYIGSEFARLSKLSNFAKFYFYVVENISYRFCDKAFIPDGDSATLLKKYPFLKNKIIGMNNAINVDLFKKIEINKKYDVVYQARLDNVQKNHSCLLEAIEGLNLKLLLIGKGKQKKNIEAESKKRKIDLTIVDRVPNEELPKLYNSARICVFPSLFEGNPKALLECMSCEMPIVAFEVPGVKNLIKNNFSGLLSVPDSLRMQTNIKKLLADSELAAQLGFQARNFIIENFSFNNLFLKEVETYKKLINLKNDKT